MMAPAGSSPCCEWAPPCREGRTGAARGRITVAFQGEPGAYGDEAILARWGGAADATPVSTFADVIAAVESGHTDFGVIPVWNSIVGWIAAGCQEIRSARARARVRGATDRRPGGGVAVIGDVHVVVRHHLLALPGAALDEIGVVCSHPVALAQCRAFFARHPRLTVQPAYDTAGAARALAAGREPGVAAVAGRAAAERYGLTILAADVQDVPDNVTHFLVVERTERARRAGVELW